MVMERKIKRALLFALAGAMIFALISSFMLASGIVYADDEETADAETTEATTEDDGTSLDATKAIAAACLIGAATVAGAAGIAAVVVKSVGGIARQPEAGGQIQTVMMLGLVFVETVVIYALVTAILIIFVL
ncbi:MAG: ATP synthase F0 subunit C [Clostridiales bacterium]|nr:ATP synthase F0 subunit C [Clostridiales bacterium]